MQGTGKLWFLLLLFFCPFRAGMDGGRNGPEPRFPALSSSWSPSFPCSLGPLCSDLWVEELPQGVGGGVPASQELGS